MLEKDRIIQRDHSENVKLFKGLKSKEKYSLYAYELNRIFGERSYDNFCKNLFSNKRIHTNSFKKMFEKPITKGGIRKIQEPFDIKEFNTCLKKMEIKVNEYNYKIKHPHEPKLSFYQKNEYLREKKLILLKKRKLPQIPDIGRYNPNYQSINTHPFFPSFSSLDYDNFKKLKKNFYAHDTINNLKKEMITNTDNNNNLKKNKSLKNQNRLSTELNCLTKNSEFNDSQMNMSRNLSNSSFGDEKNNHCLKFDSYSSRKPLVYKKMYTTELVYNNKKNNFFSRNMKGVIDFNRISNSKYGSYFDEIIRNNNNPPLGMYRPKYDFMDKKTRNIFLDKKGPLSPKFAKLKKILCGFDISSEYKLTPSLNSYNTINYDFENNKQ